MNYVKKYKTAPRTLLNYHKELSEIALNRDIEVNIGLRFKEELVLDITFFLKTNNFTFTLYQFYDSAKNKKIFNLAKELIKDRNLFEEYSKIKLY